MEDNQKALDYGVLTAAEPYTETADDKPSSPGQERARNVAIMRGACIPYYPDAPIVDDDPPGNTESLLGSSTLPAMVPIGKNAKDGTNVVQLGYVVRQAFAASGLSVADWNALSDEVRDLKLTGMIEGLKEVNGELPPDTVDQPPAES